MYEVVALVAGAGIGVALPRGSWRAFLGAAVPLCLGVGLAVSALSGELEISAGFLVFDVGQTLAAAILVSALLRAVEARARRS